MNPYQQNLNIIKDFFKRKIILFYSVFTILPIFSILFINVKDLINIAEKPAGGSIFGNVPKNLDLAGTLTSGYSLFIFEILLAVVFLLFFVKSGSDDSSLKAPVGMFRTVSVIELIVTALMSLAMVFVVLFAALYFLANFSALTSLLTVPFMFLAVPVILALIISQNFFAGSVRESVNSIYLKKTGTKFFGVMNLIAAFLCIYFTVLVLIFAGGKGANLKIVVPVTIFFCLTAAKYILGAIVGFKYSRYIEGFSDSVLAGETEKEAPEEEKPNAIICKKCGKTLTADDYFCNHCGTPVEK